jgi:hypothetical protein
VSDHSHDDDQFGNAEELREAAIWLRRDGHSNGRWLFVNHPYSEDGVPVGIVGVYTKHLDPDEAREMAAALLTAADEAQRLKTAAEAERAERERLRKECAGSHDWGDWAAGDFACRHCGSQPETRAHVFVYPMLNPLED